ncbi:hypothetical protein [Nitrosomonas supralitoralis]|uniref:Uncharacterized protein n=1 Tax=Nitrosomonas supralitoralis TaxID=2116706 RepID=A0A2P7NYD0_9PROT|nr:hypothetical protein [Nitrosomonas supralitoralis]PSJ18447.1 hypothetical protein C7H79_02350 [Nitrosomonas supralitoralis]
MVNKNWTIEEAQAANDAVLLESPERSFADPTLPLSQWAALHNLDNLHTQYIQGNKFALMQAIRECARCDLVMPPWVGSAFRKAFDTIANYKSDNWNEVFGDPIPKGAHLNALKKKRNLKYAVHLEAINILQADVEQAIDAGLFERIAEKFHIGKTQAEEYCRDVEKTTGFFLREARAVSQFYDRLNGQSKPKKRRNPTKL